MKMRSGFTLAEMLIVMGLFAFLMICFYLYVGGLKGSEEDRQIYIQQYARDLHLEIVGVSCAQTDSDGDGYVSCTLRARDASSRPSEQTRQQPIETLALECGRGGGCTTTSGCRPLKTPQHNTFFD